MVVLDPETDLSRDEMNKELAVKQKEDDGWLLIQSFPRSKHGLSTEHPSRHQLLPLTFSLRIKVTLEGHVDYYKLVWPT